MLRKSLLALFSGAVFLATGQASLAADMPVKARAGAYDWSGFYVGGTVGAAWTKADVGLDTVNGASALYAPGNIPGLNAIGSQNLTGSNSIFGGKIGYNKKINSIVVGLEADLSSFHFDKSVFSSGNPFGPGLLNNASFTTAVSTKWLATVRPRIGYAYDRALFFGTAGVAFGKVSFSNTYTGHSPLGAGNEGGASEASQTKVGWAAGAGVDYALTKNWIVSAEYLHVDLGSITATGTVANNGKTADMNFSTKLTSDIVRAGIAYKF